MMKSCIARVLVRLYPAAWRAEYGQEFADLLMARLMSPRAVANVLSSAVRQHVRSGAPWLLVGLPLAFFSLLGYAFPACTPPASPAVSWGIIVILAGAGAWSAVRRGNAGGGAAVKAALLWRAPGFTVAVLAALGILPIMVFGPRTFPNPGLAIAWTCEATPFSSWALIRFHVLVPLLELPFIGVLGWFGGLLGRAYLRRQHRRPA
jgi:hypothetical protein